MERATALVESAIRNLGVDPALSRIAGDGRVTYALRRGSARILVVLHSPSAELADGRIKVVAPVVSMPPQDQQPALFRRLLEANASQLSGALAFGISKEEVVLLSERSLRDLDASEVDEMIRRVGQVADHYDDELSAQFKVSRSSDR